MINDGGSSSVSSEVTKLVGQLPPAVQALTGVDLSKVEKMQFDIVDKSWNMNFYVFFFFAGSW